MSTSVASLPAMIERFVPLLAALAVACAGCGGDDGPATAAAPTATPTPAATPTQQAKVAGEDCSEVGDLTVEIKRRPPEDVRLLDIAPVYRAEAGGRFYASIDGTPAELASRRDDAVNYLLQSRPFIIEASDDKPGVEATARLKGEMHTVDIRVTPLCTGTLGIRYTVR
jgi:hypothetical protein